MSVIVEKPVRVILARWSLDGGGDMFRLILLVAVLIAGAPASQAADMRAVQQALAEKGYDPGPIDGLPGRRTTGALRAFQAASGLSSTGEVDDDTLRQLGLLEAPSDAVEAESSSAAAEAANPAEDMKSGPIVGDIDDIMTGHALAVAGIILKNVEARMGLPIMTTSDHPMLVEFTDHDPQGMYDNVTAGGESYSARNQTTILNSVQAKGGLDFSLDLYRALGAEIEAPDSICRDMPANAIAAMPLTHICITSGTVSYGGILADANNEVECVQGSFELTNANRSVAFVGDANCRINSNPVELRAGVWGEVSR